METPTQSGEVVVDGGSTHSFPKVDSNLKSKDIDIEVQEVIATEPSESKESSDGDDSAISDHSSDEYFTDTDVSGSSESETFTSDSEDGGGTSEEAESGQAQDTVDAATTAMSFGAVETETAVEGGRRRRRLRGKKKREKEESGQNKKGRSRTKNGRQKSRKEKKKRHHSRRRRPKEQIQQRRNLRKEQRRNHRREQKKPEMSNSEHNSTNIANGQNAWGNNASQRQAQRARNIRLAQVKDERDLAIKELKSLLLMPGAASDSRAWVVLQAVFTERSAHLHFLRQSNSATGPPPGWKGKFLGQLQQQIEMVLSGGESKEEIIGELAKNLFIPLGWSLSARSPITGRQAPNYADIDAFLSKAVRFCRAREAARKRERLKQLKPTSTELQDIREACDALWDLDEDLRLVPMRDYRIDLQRTTGGGRDAAPGPLFTWVSEDKLTNVPVYSTFIPLLDNYEFEPGKAERNSANERHEISAFLDACLDTACINYVYKWLSAKGIFSGNYRSAFKQKLEKLWFDGYARQSRSRRSDDSSAFEHVFVGEHKRDRSTGRVSVIGMHNWLAFLTFERQGSFNYYGFKRPRGRRGRNARSFESEQVLTLVFEWHGEKKPVSTCFMGTSPSFELALYTLAFLCDGGGEKTIPAELGPYKVGIQCYTFRGNKIGSCHPTDAPATADEAATVIQSRVRGRQQRRRQAYDRGRR